MWGMKGDYMSQDRFPYRAVIFDMDGVIVDTERFYFEQLDEMYAAAGIPVSHEELGGAVGASYRDFQRNLVRWFSMGGVDLSPEEAEARYDSWAEAHPADYAALLNPGVCETVRELKSRGVRVALASSSPMDNITHVLDVCGLAGAFELVVSGEQFRESKPNPEIYLHTLTALGLPASACCCIEDSVPGITAGKAAGLTVVAKREERFGFSQADADVIINEIPDVLGL